MFKLNLISTASDQQMPLSLIGTYNNFILLGMLVDVQANSNRYCNQPTGSFSSQHTCTHIHTQKIIHYLLSSRWPSPVGPHNYSISLTGITLPLVGLMCLSTHHLVQCTVLSFYILQTCVFDWYTSTDKVKGKKRKRKSNFKLLSYPSTHYRWTEYCSSIFEFYSKWYEDFSKNGGIILFITILVLCYVNNVQKY